VKSGVFLCVLLIALVFVLNTINRRSVNEYEQFYNYIAVELNEPDLCKLISKKAYIGGARIPSESEIHLLRSRCYNDVAHRYGRIELCKKVLPTNTFFLNWNKFLSENCRKDIKKYGLNKSWSSYPLMPGTIINFFEKMGYKPEILHLEGLTKDPVDLQKEYYNLFSETDIESRVERALNDLEDPLENTVIDIEIMEYLYDMAAIVKGDANYCKKIRSNSYLLSKHKKAPYYNTLNRCIYKVAWNTQNELLCDELTPEGIESKKYEKLKRSCHYNFQKKNYRHRNHFIVPRDEEKIKIIYSLLEHPLPTINDVFFDTRRLYKDYISKLSNKNNPKSVEARKKFLSRVYLLTE